MKADHQADHQKDQRVPGWILAALSSVIALAILGSGTYPASASSSASGSDPRSGTQQSSPNVTQYFQDVPSSNPFFSFINTNFLEGLATGYQCGGSGEPCVPPANLPYYRPGSNVSRAQMSKFVYNARRLPRIDISTTTDTTPLRSESDASRGTGIYGTTNGSGPSHNENDVNAGVYGFAGGAQNSVGLLAVGQNDNAALFTSHSAGSYAVQVIQNGADIEHGGTGPSDALHVGGHLTVTGGCTGCTVDAVMMNTGITDLHPGDVVSLGALAPAGTTIDGNAVAGVTTSSEAYDTGVVGVVGFRYIPADPNAPAGTAQRTGGRDETATVVEPGEYMTVLTEGTYNLVKVDAGKDGIHAGDLLTTSATTPGAAMKVTNKIDAIGAVLGKALGNLDAGTGYIPVLVTLK